MPKLLSFAVLISLLFSCSKDRDFSYQPYKSAGLPVVGSRQLIHYWNFNNTSNQVIPTFTVGGATWSYSAISDAVADSSSLNARNGDIGGSALRLRNPAGIFTLNLPTNGYKNVMFSFAAKRSSNGAQINTISYTIDGTNFITDSLQPNMNMVDTLWNVYSYDFTNIANVNDNPYFKIKIDFSVGNTNTSGNDRFDNITVDADVVPGGGLGSSVLIHYWNFNNSDTTKSVSIIPGAGFLFDFATVTSITGYYDFTTSTATQNARNADVAGNTLRVRNPVNSFIIKAPTTGYRNISISYAVDRTSSGASTNNVSYSVDGGINFVTTSLVSPTYTPSLDPTYSLVTYDFSAIPSVNNNPNFQFKVAFANGNLGTSGNNRFDNITIDGFKQ